MEKLAELTLPKPARCIKALLAMVPPPPSLPSFGREDNAHSTHANSSPTVLAHAVFWVLKARVSLVRPLPGIPQVAKTVRATVGTMMATPAATAES